MPSTDPPMITRAPKPFGFSPAYMPNGRPVITAINRAQDASSTVAGKRSAIKESAGRPNIKEFPRSPDKAAVKNFQY